MIKEEPVYKIIVADSQYLITESLKVILSKEERFELTHVVDSGYELFKVLANHPCDLLIIDFASLDLDGFDELKALRQKFPQLNILILTNQISRNEFTEISKAGIKNIIYKTADREELFSAMEASLKGKKFYTGDILDLIMEMGDKKNLPEDHIQLTASEVEIVRLIAQGLTTKAIADKRNISFHTVMTHRKNIFRKLGINNASELLMYAMKAGLIDTIEYHI